MILSEVENGATPNGIKGLCTRDLISPHAPQCSTPNGVIMRVVKNKLRSAFAVI